MSESGEFLEGSKRSVQIVLLRKTEAPMIFMSFREKTSKYVG